MGEDLPVELPAEPLVDRPQRTAGDVVHHVGQVVRLGRHGSEPGERLVLGGIGAFTAEGVTHVVGPDLGIGLGHG